MTQPPNAELQAQLARSWTRELAQDGDVVSARVPELPGCLSEGANFEEALHNLDDALELWLSAAVESGAAIPDPPAESESADFSGRFTVRTLKSTHRRLAERAEAEGVSLNQLVTSILGSAVDDRTPRVTTADRYEVREDITADAIERTPRSIGALKGIATHLRNGGDTNLACLVYAFAAERVARDAGAQEAAKELGTAAALAHRNNKYALAEALWRESTRLDMTNVRSASRLGQLLHHQGRYEEATDLLELAAADDNYAANFLGWSQVQLGLRTHDPELEATGVENVAAALRRWAYQANSSVRPGWERQVRRLASLGARSAQTVEQVVSYANANANWGPVAIEDILGRSDDPDEEASITPAPSDVIH